MKRIFFKNRKLLLVNNLTVKTLDPQLYFLYKYMNAHQYSIDFDQIL